MGHLGILLWTTIGGNKTDCGHCAIQGQENEAENFKELFEVSDFCAVVVVVIVGVTIVNCFFFV